MPATAHQELAEMLGVAPEHPIMEELEQLKVSQALAEGTSSEDLGAESFRTRKRIGELAIEGFEANEISDQGIVFLSRLTSHKSNDTTVRYSDAQRDLERFQRMQPGVQMLEYGGFGALGENPCTISEVSLGFGGILRAIPTVSLPVNPNYWYFSPWIKMELEDGRSKQDLFVQRRAIGTDEVTEVVTTWLDESYHGTDDYHDGDLVETLGEIAKVIPLDLAIPRLEAARTEITKTALQSLEKDVSEYSLAPLLRGLYVVAGEAALKEAAKNALKHGYISPTTLTQQVAAAQTHDFSRLSNNEAFNALAKAAHMLADVSKRN